MYENRMIPSDISGGFMVVPGMIPSFFIKVTITSCILYCYLGKHIELARAIEYRCDLNVTPLAAEHR